jgi:hypothetical protein
MSRPSDGISAQDLAFCRLNGGCVFFPKPGLISLAQSALLDDIAIVIEDDVAPVVAPASDTIAALSKNFGFDHVDTGVRAFATSP